MEITHPYPSQIKEPQNNKTKNTQKLHKNKYVFNTIYFSR